MRMMVFRYIAVLLCLYACWLIPPVQGANLEGKTKIRAAYWGLQSAAEGREQLPMLRTHGLNTALLKEGNYELSLDLWRAWARLAAENGIQLMPVINFAGPAEIERLHGTFSLYRPHGAQVFANTPCPFDATYWNAAVAERLVQLAQLSNILPLVGAAFDTEMYGADTVVYDELCLCDTCWTEFAQAGRHEALTVPAAQRFEYLRRHVLTEPYHTFQTDRLQRLLARIEQQVHSINPDFRIGFLAYRDHWFYDTLIRGLGTPEQPVYVFSETTYVRGYTPHVAAEQARIKARPADPDSPPLARYVPGLWLERFYPQELPVHLCHLAAQTDGYWLFSAASLWNPAPKPEPYALYAAPADYWRALQQANEAIVRCADDAQAGRAACPPLTPFSVYDPSQHKLTTPATLSAFLRNVVAAHAPPPASSSGTTVRGTTLWHCVRPSTVSTPETFEITHVPVGVYNDPTHYMMFAANGDLLTEGRLTADQPRAVPIWPPETSGVVSLLTESGANATQVVLPASAACAAEASPAFPLATINTTRPYAFYVAPGPSRFVVSAYCSQGEAAVISLLAPDRTLEHETAVSGFQEIEVRPAMSPTPAANEDQAASPNPQLRLQLRAGQAIPLTPVPQPVSTGRFWTLAVTPKPFTTFEDIQFYFEQTEFPYVILSVP
jgi:hypothetical protein